METAHQYSDAEAALSQVSKSSLQVCREKAVSIPNLTRRSAHHTDVSDPQKGEDGMSPIEESVSVACRVGEMHALIRLGPPPGASTCPCKVC